MKNSDVKDFEKLFIKMKAVLESKETAEFVNDPEYIQIKNAMLDLDKVFTNLKKANNTQGSFVKEWLMNNFVNFYAALPTGHPNIKYAAENVDNFFITIPYSFIGGEDPSLNQYRHYREPISRNIKFDTLKQHFENRMLDIKEYLNISGTSPDASNWYKNYLAGRHIGFTIKISKKITRDETLLNEIMTIFMENIASAIEDTKAELNIKG